MDLGAGSWAILNIVGPLLIVLVLGWAFLKNKKNKGGIDRTERATHELYDEENAHRHDRDNDKPA
ncbi:MAG TPA: hypothetical protein VF655_13320 [Allosphingosinicella sp.]